MFGVIHPPVSIKPVVRYKCRDCGYKAKPIAKVLLKKCPSCGGSDFGFTLGFVDKKPPLFIVH
jgi:predicted Zn-ribbon and HTH transcriptional regulator